MVLAEVAVPATGLVRAGARVLLDAAWDAHRVARGQSDVEEAALDES